MSLLDPELKKQVDHVLSGRNTGPVTAYLLYGHKKRVWDELKAHQGSSPVADKVDTGLITESPEGIGDDAESWLLS